MAWLIELNIATANPFLSLINLALFCSGSGTNAQAIMHRFASHEAIRVSCLLSNNAHALALQRASEYYIPTLAFNRTDWKGTSIVDDFLVANQVNYLILAGFLWLVPRRLLAAYPGRVLNIHPALLPHFGGAGMWGHHVHKAVSHSGIAETGITIHLADEEYDHGAHIFQHKIAITPHENPETIEQKVRALELEHYGQVIEDFVLKSQSASKNP